MGIPRAVAEQARKVEEQYFGNTETEDQPAEASADTTDQPEPENEAPEQIEVNEGTAEPVEVEQDQPEAHPEPSDGNFEHKFKVLQGKYNAEVKKVRDENKALKGEVQHLHAQLARMNDLLTRMAERPAEKPAEQANTPQQSPRDALLELARKFDDGELSMSEYEAQRAELQEQIDNDRFSRVQQETEAKTRAMTAEQRFWSDLSAQVPDWQTVNEDPAFHEWLAEQEGLSGMTRQQVLEAAQRNVDAGTVVRIFNAYKQASQPQQPTNRAALEKQVAPGKSKAAPRQPRQQGFDPRKLAELTKQQLAARDPEQKRRIEQQINDLIASASAA